jgi:CRP/FNR family transcriptional regulator
MKIDDLINANFKTLFEENLLQELSNYGVLKTVESETIIVEIRREIRFIPFIVSGIAKVMRRDGQGNGILLHFLSSQQTSAIAVCYALQQKKSEIRVKSESNVSYIAIPVKVVLSWFKKFDSWTNYYNELNQIQTAKLIERINDIAFTDLEYRLTKYLEEYSLLMNSNVICKKHFDIARDLKVSREAISRTLKKMERDEIITLGRNKIILN